MLIKNDSTPVVAIVSTFTQAGSLSIVKVLAVEPPLYQKPLEAAVAAFESAYPSRQFCV